MNAPFKSTEEGLMALVESVRAEAAMEPDPVHLGEAKSRPRSSPFTARAASANPSRWPILSHMMAQQGKRVLLIGCDPKSDTTSLLFSGARLPRGAPPIIETSARKKAAGEEVEIGDVLLQERWCVRHGARRTGSRRRLRRTRNHSWLRAARRNWASTNGALTTCCSTSWATWCAAASGLPIARDMCQKGLSSSLLQRSAVALRSPTIVCSAVDYFRKLGGNVGVAGMVINKDDGTGEAAAFAEAVGIPVLATIPADEDNPPQERELPDHRHAGMAAGDRSLPNWPRTSPPPSRSARHRSTRTDCLACSPARWSAAMSCSSRPPQADMRGGIVIEKPSLEIVIRSGLRQHPMNVPAPIPRSPSRRRNRKSSTTAPRRPNSTMPARRSRAAAPRSRGNGQRRRGLPWRRRRNAACSLDFQRGNDGAAQGRLPRRARTDRPQSMCPAFGVAACGPCA